MAQAAWYDEHEWRAVGRALFFGSALERQQAVQRVCMWECRARVPVAVEASAQLWSLLTTLNNSNTNNNTSSSVDSVALLSSTRLALAMALTRLVNGLADPLQGTRARSVRLLTQALGLPDALVDARHDATHAALPSLAHLTALARLALDWLLNNYWRPSGLEADDQKEPNNDNDNDVNAEQFAFTEEFFDELRETEGESAWRELIPRIDDEQWLIWIVQNAHETRATLHVVYMELFRRKLGPKSALWQFFHQQTGISDSLTKVLRRSGHVVSQNSAEMTRPPLCKVKRWRPDLAPDADEGADADVAVPSDETNDRREGSVEEERELVVDRDDDANAVREFRKKLRFE